MEEPRRRRPSTSMRPPSTPSRRSSTTPRRVKPPSSRPGSRPSSRPSSRRGSLASLIPGPSGSMPCESPSRMRMPPPQSPAAHATGTRRMSVASRSSSFRENLDAAAAAAAGDRVLTIVRVKPADADGMTRPGVMISPCGTEISLPGAARSIGCNIGNSTPSGHTQTTSYRFDHVCDGSTTQEEMFALAGVPIADAWLEGYNGTIFAYGQTGSGKTHTLKGKSLREGPSRGLMPRIMDYVFEKLAERRQHRGTADQGQEAPGETGGEGEADEEPNYECTLSYLQIYSERISDLLERRTRSVPSYNSQGAAMQPGASFSQGNGGDQSEWQDLKLRESGDRVYAEGLTEVPVASAEEAVRMIALGNSNRKVAWTAMNAESSRSHTVLTLVLKCKKNGLVQTSCLNLIDLAGSENQATSQANSATQFGEACKINLSLTYLGSLLRDVASGRSFVNYRNSKLTLLLKDSLGGNSKTCVVATVNPALRYKQQTLSTLKFASHLKYVRNNAVRNVTAADSVEVWQRECKSLELKLKQAQGEIAVLKAHEAAREDMVEARLRKKIAAEIRRQVREELAAEQQQQQQQGVDEEELRRRLTEQAGELRAEQAQLSKELAALHEAELREAVREAREQERAAAQAEHDDALHAALDAAEDARQQLLDMQLETQMQREQGERTKEADKELLLKNAASLKEQMSLSRSLLKRITQAEATEERLRAELSDAREDVGRAERELRAGLGEAEREAAGLRQRLQDTTDELSHARKCEQQARERAATAEAALSAAEVELQLARAAQRDQEELLQEQEGAIEASLEEQAERTRAAERLAEARKEQLQRERAEHAKVCARQEQALEALEWRRDMGEHALSTLARELKEAEHKLSQLQGARQEDSQAISGLRARKDQLAAAKRDMERAFRDARSEWVTEKQALRDNASRLEADRQRAVIRSIQGEFEGDLDLATPERRFLLHAELRRLQESTKRLLDYNFFLMSDVLIYCKPMHRRGAKPGQPGRPQRYRMHRALKLALCRLVDLPDTPELQHAFRVNSPQKAVVLVCGSAAQKKEWLGVMEKQILECVQARDREQESRKQQQRQHQQAVSGGAFQMPAARATPRRPSVLNRLANTLTGRKSRRGSVASTPARTTAKANGGMSTPSVAATSAATALTTPSKVLAGAVPMFNLNDTLDGAAANDGNIAASQLPPLDRHSSVTGSKARTVSDAEEAAVTSGATAGSKAQEASHCELCMRAFNALLRRRHTCGSCAGAVCGNCSQHRVAVMPGDGKGPRQCDACHGDATGMLAPSVPILTRLLTNVPSVQVSSTGSVRLSASEAARHFQRANENERRRRLSSTAGTGSEPEPFIGAATKENVQRAASISSSNGSKVNHQRRHHRRASVSDDALRTRHMV